MQHLIRTVYPEPHCGGRYSERDSIVYCRVIVPREPSIPIH